MKKQQGLASYLLRHFFNKINISEGVRSLVIHIYVYVRGTR
jgi:hypothetical protein